MFEYCNLWEAQPSSRILATGEFLFWTTHCESEKLVPLPVWKFLQKRALSCHNHFPPGRLRGKKCKRNYWTNTTCPSFKVIIKVGINAFNTAALQNLSLFIQIWADLFQSASLEDIVLHEQSQNFKASHAIQLQFHSDFCSFFLVFLKMSLETSHSDSNSEMAFAFEIFFQVSQNNLYSKAKETPPWCETWRRYSKVHRMRVLAH